MRKIFPILVALLITFLTLSLFWVIFFSRSETIVDPNDPTNQTSQTIIPNPFDSFSLTSFFSSVLYFYNSPFLSIFIFFLIIFLIYYSSHPFFYIILKLAVNICTYCDDVRHSYRFRLVNGKCAKCDTHVCKKCFFFTTNKSSTKQKINGCPKCGSNSFIYDKSLGNNFTFTGLKIILRRSSKFQKFLSKYRVLKSWFQQNEPYNAYSKPVKIEKYYSQANFGVLFSCVK